MNVLHLGTTKNFLQNLKPDFLLIADDTSPFEEKFKTARVFDPTIHSFNPLEGMDFKKARDIATILYSYDSAGKDTLTVRNGRRALARLLLNASRFDKITGDEKDPAEAEALATIHEVLFSPLLKKVFCTTKHFSFKGSVIAKIDRATLGDYDAFLLALFLIGQFQGQVVVLDGGFYLRPLHLSLIRQNRLTVGVNHLEELEPKLRNAVLQFQVKHARGCIYEDAKTLAEFNHLVPDPTRKDNEYNDFIKAVMTA